MVIGTSVDLVVAIIFIENQPGIDISDITGDVDFLGEDEDLREVIHGIVDFLGDSNIAINGKSAVHEHGESIHKFFTRSVASRDEITSMIELIEISGAIHGAEAGVPLVVELGEAEVVLGRSLIGSEAVDSVTRVSSDSVTEAGLEAGEDGRADAGDVRFARFIVI